jgi:ABC-type transport system substrate-binding protein
MTQETRPSHHDHHRPLSRRGFLRSTVLLDGVAVGGSLLAACSSAATPAATTAPPATSAAQAGGTAALKPTTGPAPAAAAAATANGRLVYANPSKLRTPDTISVYGLQEFQIGRQMMEPLLDLTQDGKLAPAIGLAATLGPVWST